ncbi:exported protein of unknown function [Microbacterium sp. Nx66]|nr:exported protein of unknown function [Microbacterium sp. Nx66]
MSRVRHSSPRSSRSARASSTRSSTTHPARACPSPTTPATTPPRPTPLPPRSPPARADPVSSRAPHFLPEVGRSCLPSPPPSTHPFACVPARCGRSQRGGSTGRGWVEGKEGSAAAQGAGRAAGVERELLGVHRGQQLPHDLLVELPGIALSDEDLPSHLQPSLGQRDEVVVGRAGHGVLDLLRVVGVLLHPGHALRERVEHAEVDLAVLLLPLPTLLGEIGLARLAALGLDRLQRRDVLLVLLIPGDLQAPDEQRQREPLQQERADGDDEGDHDDGVRGLGVEAGQVGGGHRDRQGHHAAHARPGDDRVVLPREPQTRHALPHDLRPQLVRALVPPSPGPPATLVELPGSDATVHACEPAAVLEVRPGADRVDVERPDDEHHEQHGAGEQEDVPHRLAAEVVEHPRELEADVGEHEALQQQVGRQPQRRLLLPGRVVGARGVEADEEAHGHDREDAGAEQMLRDVVRTERGEKTEGADHDGVADAHPELVQHDSEDEPDPHPYADSEEELPDAAPDRHGRPGEDRGEHPVERERGRVVDEALPRQHRHDAAGQTETTTDRRRRHRVRRSDDGPEQQRARQRERRQDPPGHESDGERGEQHQPDPETADLREAALEPDERHVEGGGVQQRRQHEAEQQVPVDLQLRHERQERRGQRDDGHEQRGRPSAPPRDGGHGDGSDEDVEDPGFHAESVAASSALPGPRSMGGVSVADGALPSRPVRIEGFAEARVLVLQVEDPRDPGDVDAVPAEFGRATQAGDVVVAVPTRAAVTASGREKPLALEESDRRLRQVDELGGDGDAVERGARVACGHPGVLRSGLRRILQVFYNKSTPDVQIICTPPQPLQGRTKGETSWH